MSSYAWRRAAKAFSRHASFSAAAAAASAPVGVIVAGCFGTSRLWCLAACEDSRKPTPPKKETTHDPLWVAGTSLGDENLMAARYDTYGGVIVDPTAVPQDADMFEKKMRSSIAEWSKLEKQGVWLQLDVKCCDLIPIALKKFGFEYHHAEKSYIMLTKWLPTDKASTLPMNASHTIGVGAVVTDDQNRVLLVREKHGPAARLGIWKVPTGLADPGEDLHVAAVREVKEETGVDATFEFLGGFMMHHGGNLAHANKSNIFFAVKCKATSTDITTQSSEIAEAKWFTVEEWRAMQFPEQGSVFDALNRSTLDAEYAHIRAKELSFGHNRPGLRWLYYPTPQFGQM